jgi:putative ABC transport system permease protein
LFEEGALIQDLRYGLRMLLKRPGFTIIAVLTLAFGIGANTIVFSGVYAFLIQGLPYANSDRMVVISRAASNGVETGISYPDFIDWKSQGTLFEGMAALRSISVNLTEAGAAERVTASLVSREFFALMGGRPAVGRGFGEEEFNRGGARAVILSHVFWQRFFGGDSEIVGKRLRLDDREFTVVGVMPESFRYPFRAALWLPLDANEKPEAIEDRLASYYDAIALVKPGVSSEAAANEMALLAARTGEEGRVRQSELAIKVTALGETIPGIRKYRNPVLVLQLAVVFVLLIASANLANMLLARNAVRNQEFTIRLALGAGRGRLIRQLLAESTLLGLVGSAVGVLLAFWGLNALRSSVGLRVPGGDEIGINAPVLLITLAASLVTSLCIGLAPAIIASRQDINESLKSSASNTTSDPRQRRFSRLLATAEVALAVVLLAGAGMMIRTFLNLTKEDPGFNPRNAVALSLALPQFERADYDRLASHYEEAIKQIKAVPGVEAAGAATYLPLIGYNPGTDFIIGGQSTSPGNASRADIQPVTSGYFQAIGMSLVRGRTFADADMSATPQSVIINNAFAKRFCAETDPLGKSLQLLSGNLPRAPLVIVGVVGDVKQFGLHTEPRPEIYIPGYRQSMTIIVRATTPPETLSVALGEAVRRSAGDGASYSLKTMEEAVADSIERRRIFMVLLGVLSSVALVMAAMGIYGVISYMVARRTREIGIRMALGAQGGHILRSVIGQGLSLACAGIAIGLIASLALTRAMRSMLYGVGTVDLMVIAGLALLICAVALAASYLPARRATRVDPVVALRTE